jgi:hypothetical protein
LKACRDFHQTDGQTRTRSNKMNGELAHSKAVLNVFDSTKESNQHHQNHRQQLQHPVQYFSLAFARYIGSVGLRKGMFSDPHISSLFHAATTDIRCVSRWSWCHPSVHIGYVPSASNIRAVPKYWLPNFRIQTKGPETTNCCRIYFSFEASSSREAMGVWKSRMSPKQQNSFQR